MIALAAVAAAWVLVPLFRARDDGGPPLEPAGEPRAIRDAADAALRDFELDYATGKISPEDYQFLRPRYEAQANGAERRARGRNQEGDAGSDAGPAPGARSI